MQNEDDAISYIIEFLVGKDFSRYVSYGSELSADAKISIMRSNFFDEGVYGTAETLPKAPFSFLPETDIPFLFGSPKIERTGDGRIVLHADLVASAFFMLSRYEDMIKPECRFMADGGFCAKHSIIFQHGYGIRPLVDEWGKYLLELLKLTGVQTHEEQKGFSRIWLTHDNDEPFMFTSFKDFCVQVIRSILGRCEHVPNLWEIYYTGKNDPYNTFSDLIKWDNSLKEKCPYGMVESLYFLISGKSTKKNKYCSLSLKKYMKILKMLEKSGAKFGLHVSHEGGDNPKLIKNEIQRLPDFVDTENLYSRHHYLKWKEPYHVDEMQSAGIKHDFTLGYNDCIGFRVGTCKPYRFINPRDRRLTQIIIHPLEIMEGSLAYSGHMNLNFNCALAMCKEIIDKVFEHNGELVLLFHNSSFTSATYYEQLYIELHEYIAYLVKYKRVK